ncbi:MAG: SsrA-binding protein [Clostridia bacterium 41_269]|nr:MAG: SsrA-binding protein [Clostridia bacterium 41_269]
MAEKKIVAVNKKARHDYFIEETYETGIALTGTEVKSIRAGKVNLRDSYAEVKNGEVFVHNMHISPYEAGNQFNHEPKRTRKLLLHKYEIRRLIGKTQERGYTLVPLKLYFNEKGKVKLEIGLAKGKKLYDKRKEIAKRDAEREMRKTFAQRYKGI